MAKKQSSLINMVLTLFVITAVAAVALGFVYSFTKGPIEDVKKEKLSKALSEVLPEFDTVANEIIAITWDKKLDSVPVFKVFKGNVQVGTAVEAITHIGFGGDVKVLVGFDANGNIFGYSVLEHKETAGLGSKMGEWFQKGGKGNVIGKDLSTKADVKKDGGDVDAITAATISSRAFCDALNKAYAAYKASGNTCAQQAEAEPLEEVKEKSEEPAENVEPAAPVETAENVEPTNEGGNDNE